MGTRAVKRVLKREAPPPALVKYLERCPESSWEEMRQDGENHGLEVPKACRDAASEDQGGLCAYCEQKHMDSEIYKWRVEHFHPKSDKGEKNWDLDWNNMLFVCSGGTRIMPRLLSCDAHKEQMISKRKLDMQCEGLIINPLELPAFPNLFSFVPHTGHLKPDEEACGRTVIPGNKMGSTAALVKNTIDMLNLNCHRLSAQRKELADEVEDFKEKLRNRNFTYQMAKKHLVTRFFEIKHPQFFTTLRCCLGAAAEEHLHSQNYQG